MLRLPSFHGFPATRAGLGQAVLLSLSAHILRQGLCAGTGQGMETERYSTGTCRIDLRVPGRFLLARIEKQEQHVFCINTGIPGLDWPYAKQQAPGQTEDFSRL